MAIDAPRTVGRALTRPKTGALKRSLVVAGHRTSISLEDQFWRALKALARERSQSVNALVAEIDADRGPANLSSAIRLFVFENADQ